ncbi:MAG: hypothetical protein K0V04_01025 [Deltaproteobacteria bacterium]|nr:hypothetical protein [Deltaproteobacteria bacterium]
MRIASFVVLGLTIALFALWWGFMRAPGPVEVCEHIVQVTVREAGEHAMSPESLQRLVEDTRTKCIEHKLDKIQLRGRIKYAAYAKCVIGSQTLSDIGRC